MFQGTWFCYTVLLHGASAAEERSLTERPRLQRTFTHVLLYILLAIAGLVLTGCTATTRQPVPLGLVNQVNVKGFERVRIWGDEALPDFDDIVTRRLQQTKEKRPDLLQKRQRVISYLALSGGGSNGAFGAGILNGWSASGKRPTFEIVSGISTGALIAPFAFLGPDYDRQLQNIYTLYSTDDIMQPQVLAGLTGGNALSDTKPMQKLIAKYVDQDLLDAVAREHLKGRRLLVGTTNIDADRPVIWDMGQVAIGDPKQALRLFRSILLASASLPGLFPPVYIKVNSKDGTTYEEMHVDGGTTENAFLLPVALDLHKLNKMTGNGVKRRIYIIANDKTGPSPDITENTVLGIAGRSIATLIKQQLEGDLIKLYLRAKDNRIDYNLVSIPLTFNARSKEAFDLDYMRQLYELGFITGQRGIKWVKRPPGI